MTTDLQLCTRILDAERRFASDFTSTLQRPWGHLHWNTQIANSYDSNHAILSPETAADPNRIVVALAEIRSFYGSLAPERNSPQISIQPRLYHLGLTGSGAVLRRVIQDQGWSFYDEPERWFVHREPSRIQQPPTLQIQRVTQASPALLAMVERTNSLRAARVLQHRLTAANYHLLVGRAAGEPVTIASLHCLGDLTLVDDVLTDTNHRGRGYGRELIHYLVHYHQHTLGNTLYLYASNPTAIRIYEAAGFTPLPDCIEFWSAWWPT